MTLDELRSALADRDAKLDIDGIVALEGPVRAEAEALLIAALSADDERVAQSLASLGGEAGKSALESYARHGGRDYTRLFVLHSLWDATSERQWVEPLLFLLGSPDEEVRRTAAVLARYVPKELALPRLRQLMLDDGVMAVRAVALDTTLALHGFDEVPRSPESLLGPLFGCIGAPLKTVRQQALGQLDEVLTLETEVVAVCNVDVTEGWAQQWFVAMRDGATYPEEALAAREGFERLWVTNHLLSMIHLDARAVRMLRRLEFEGLAEIFGEARGLDLPADVAAALVET